MRDQEIIAAIQRIGFQDSGLQYCAENVSALQKTQFAADQNLPDVGKGFRRFNGDTVGCTQDPLESFQARSPGVCVRQRSISPNSASGRSVTILPRPK